MAAAAEAHSFYPVEEIRRPHLQLVPDNNAELLVTPEDELAKRRARFAGQVTMEGLQAKYDAVTELAEGIDGQMRSTIELTLDGDELYGPDGRSLTKTAEKGLEAAIENAKDNPNLEFEVDRRRLELEEVDIITGMIKTGKANTFFVTTDYPSALEGTTESIGGYNARRKQALNRAVMVDSTGKTTLVSQTLDGSNRQALEAVHADLGFKTASGEMLGQRRQMNLSDEEQKRLMNRSTNAYDRSMEQQFGGEWYAGRRPIDYRNTFEFASRQHDLIDIYTENRLADKLNNNLMYNLIATANARFEKDQAGRKKSSSTSVLSAAGIETNFNRTSHSKSDVLWEIQMEGKMARRAGKSFNACGSTYTSTGDESTEEKLAEAGYGSRNGESKSWHGGKKFYNSECRSCKKVKREVGACHICEGCVNNPKQSTRKVTGRKTTEKPAHFVTPVKKQNVMKIVKAETSSI